MKFFVICAIFCGAGVLAMPASQPVYTGTRYVTAQLPQQIQLIQASQPQAQARLAQAIYDGQGLGSQATAPQTFQQQLPQNVLGSSVDRQVQRVAQVGGQQYLQQIQALQVQGQLSDAQAGALRKAQAQVTLPARLQQQAQYEAQVAQRQPQQQQIQYRAVAQPQPQIQYVARQQPQPQVQYVQRPVGPGPRKQPQLQQQQPLEDPEDADVNTSYQFGFDVKDDLYTNYQNRKEQKDGDKISGSYSVVDSDGYIRTVTYTADPKEGFKAEVSREPTNIVVKIPTPAPHSLLRHQPQQQYIQSAPSAGRVQGQKQRIVYQYQQEPEQ